MNGPPVGDVAAAVRLQPVAQPGQARRALAPAVRAKLERLEANAEAAAALARITSGRVRDTRDQQQALARRIEELRVTPRGAGSWVPSPADGPHARVWRPAADADLPALEADFVAMTSDLTRLMHEAEAAQDRSTAAGQVAEHARRHLGV
jgi:hypothetical protein